MSKPRCFGGVRFLVIVLVVAGAFARGVAEAGTKSDEAAGEQSKQPPEQGALGGLRPYMDMSDAEWQTILPYLNRVQILARELRDLREARKSFDLSKNHKGLKISKQFKEFGAGEANASTAPALPPPQSLAALTDVSDKSAELRALLLDKNARPADIRAQLAAYRAARAQAEKVLTDDLTQARAKLTELLTPRQELACVLGGLLQ